METPDRRTPFSDAELAEFRALIDAKRRHALDDVELMRARLKEDREAGSDSAYSLHMADAGSDAAERERLYQSIARQQTFVGHLDRALRRIENRTYGVCRVSGRPISKERLTAVPHTETSIEAKLAEQKRR
ncbi:MAG TPA: molecular chaperone DnaK [Rubricoccaceae bacterium]